MLPVLITVVIALTQPFSPAAYARGGISQTGNVDNSGNVTVDQRVTVPGSDTPTDINGAGTRSRR